MLMKQVSCSRNRKKGHQSACLSSKKVNKEREGEVCKIRLSRQDKPQKKVDIQLERK